MSLALQRHGHHRWGGPPIFPRISAVRRGLNPFYSARPAKPTLAHHSPPQLPAAGQAPALGAVWWQESLGTRATTSGQEQGKQRSHSGPPLLSVPTLSLSTLLSSTLSYPRGSKIQFCPHPCPATTRALSPLVSPPLRAGYLALPPPDSGPCKAPVWQG